MKRIVTITATNQRSEVKNGTKQYLLDNGFKVSSTCNCSGSHTIKMEYDTTRGLVRLHLRSSSFLIEKPGGKFVRYPIAKIKEVVNEVKNNFEPHTPAPKA